MILSANSLGIKHFGKTCIRAKRNLKEPVAKFDIDPICDTMLGETITSYAIMAFYGIPNFKYVLIQLRISAH